MDVIVIKHVTSSVLYYNFCLILPEFESFFWVDTALWNIIDEYYLKRLVTRSKIPIKSFCRFAISARTKAWPAAGCQSLLTVDQGIGGHSVLLVWPRYLQNIFSSPLCKRLILIRKVLLTVSGLLQYKNTQSQRPYSLNFVLLHATG